MKAIRWRGGYSDLSVTAMTNYDTGLKTTFGFTAVGAPIRRTFGTDGIFAVAAYEQAVVSLLAQAGQVRINAWIGRTVDWEALKQFTRTTFGLNNHVVIEDNEIS